MSYVQYIIRCKNAAKRGIRTSDHPKGRKDCIVIVGELDGEVVSHSHEHESIDPFSRLNTSYTTVKDLR